MNAPTIEDLTIDKTEGRHGIICRICSDPEPWDPWDPWGDTDAYQGVEVYGPSRVPKGMEWGTYNRWGDVPELIREARFDGWTVIPVADICETIRPRYYETDVDSANGFLAVRPETLKEWGLTGSRATLQRKARAALRAMIPDRDSWYMGEVYGFTVERDGEVLESVWGFYRTEDVDADAACALRRAEEEADREAREVQAWAERDVVTV